jgi:uncharacterized protein (UPF0332 family)
VKPETADYLAKAQRTLSEARAIAGIGLAEAAGRAAYLTAFHAAQALIFERTGKVAKTHNGVRSEFAHILKDYPDTDHRFPAFLAQAYNLKSIADYGVDSEITVTLDEAQEAIDMAERFLAEVSILVGP